MYQFDRLIINDTPSKAPVFWYGLDVHMLEFEWQARVLYKDGNGVDLYKHQPSDDRLRIVNTPPLIDSKLSQPVSSFNEQGLYSITTDKVFVVMGLILLYLLT